MSFLGTKSCLAEKLKSQTYLFCEIPKAVYLSFDWVPKIIQKSFQTMEQKLVQRCDTKVGADACKASQLNRSFFQKNQYNFKLRN